jgi:hypothetical protein
MLTRRQAVEFLRDQPVKYAHLLGFNKLTDIHNDWIREMVLGKEDYTLEAHRGSYKTTCVSIAIAETMLLLPSLRNLFMRKTDDDVKEIINQVRKILESPQTQVFVNAIYGISLRLPVSNATELSTNLIVDAKGTSQTVAISANSNLTGRHFDRIFDDDIINVKDRISRAEREHTKVVYQELRNVLNRGGKMVNTLTPWHKEDASSLMAKPHLYTWKDTGLISKKEIEEIKDSMSPSLFAANYELKHIASEDVIFEDAQIGADASKVMNATFCHIDAAYGGEDYTAFTICKKSEGKYYVLGKLWQKAVDECTREICDLRQNYLAGKICCETNGDKGYLAKALRERGERVLTYHEDMNKYIKIVTHLKADWKDVVFVKGTDQEYIDQILDYNEYAEHDDAPDSLACMIRLLHPRKDDGITSGFGY